MLKAQELRKKYLDFFQSKKHAIISSYSLIPENNPTLLFINCGMAPLEPYLMGEKHPLGKRLADVQKCIRTIDIEEVGDKTHHTFFEMLGNWSLGDYFKKEAIEWSLEFLTDKKWLALSPKKLFVSIFEGDEDAPFDQEAVDFWKNEFKKLGIKALVYGKDAPEKGAEFRIFPLGKKDNWWGPAGETGSCGPDTEIFYYLKEGEPDVEEERPGFKDDNFLEIWNNVFMQYNKQFQEQGGKKIACFTPLKSQCVDTGMGLERILAVVNGEFDNYKGDLFSSIMQKVEEETGFFYGESSETDRSLRIIADHIRASVFIIGDGITPSNLDQGYILRRLIRRAIRHIRTLKRIKDHTFIYQSGSLKKIVEVVIRDYSKAYFELKNNQKKIFEDIAKEEKKFSQGLEKGMVRFEKIAREEEEADNGKINGKIAFDLYQTFGFPLEITEEMAKERDLEVDHNGFYKEFLEHQKLSRKGAEKKFKGGLADAKERTVRLHTAVHLMLAGLRKILGAHIHQKGSNINEERLRFDFSHPEKLKEEEIKAVESFVNRSIQDKVEVQMKEMTLTEAKKTGAEGIFTNRYGAKVKVYTIAGYSKEICGGPHVKNTSEIGKFKIIKQESSGGGVRRIKAIVED